LGGEGKGIAAHRIYLNVQLVTIPMFHVFPNKEHAITRSGLLRDINELSAPVLKIRELLLADLLKCSVNDGDLLKNWGMAWFRMSIESRMSMRKIMPLHNN
jgi:hypothetical protein